jgi:hypothetical protein
MMMGGSAGSSSSLQDLLVAAKVKTFCKTFFFQERAFPELAFFCSKTRRGLGNGPACDAKLPCASQERGECS